MYKRIIAVCLVLIYCYFCVIDITTNPLISSVNAVYIIKANGTKELLLPIELYNFTNKNDKIEVQYNIKRNKKGTYVADRFLVNVFQDEAIHIFGPLVRHISSNDDLLSTKLIVHYTLPDHVHEGCNQYFQSQSYYYNNWNIVYLFWKQEYQSVKLHFCYSGPDALTTTKK